MIKVAVVGVGPMGRNHVRNYYQMGEVELIAVCDKNPLVLKEMAQNYKVKTYLNHQDLLKDNNVDAISLSVPTKDHYRLALDFLNRGVAVLVEKPLAANIKEAREIVKQAKKKSAILQVGHVERFNPVVTKLQELLKKGRFGKLLSINVKRIGLLPPKVGEVNVVTELAIHDLDIISQITGRLPNSVFARGGTGLIKGREDHAEIFLDFENFGCFIQVNRVTPIKIRNLSLTGTKGHAELNYVTQQLDFYESKYKSYKPVGFKEFVVKFGKPKKLEIPVTKAEPLRRELESFIKAVKGKKQPEVSAAEGLRAVQLAEVVNRSIRTGRKIKLG